MKRTKILWLRLLVWGLVIFILCALPVRNVEGPKIPHLDKVAHFGLFFFFAAFALGWLRTKKERGNLKNILLVLFLTAFYGALIEWMQGKYFGRTADVWDWVADMIGGLMGILAYPLLHHFRICSEKWFKKLITKHCS